MAGPSRRTVAWTAAIVCVAGAVTLIVQAAAWTKRQRDRPSEHPSVATDPRTSCGPVSLAVVSHLLGTPISIEEFNRLTGVGPTGTTSMLDLKRALEAKGFRVSAKRFGPRSPLPAEGVMILHLRRSHFLVALPVEGERAIVVDLPKPVAVSTRKTLSEQWTGAALLASQAGQ
jgi:ABC-type bacteriocin/lantibiotic exporter with double-glycine peptidase domain